MSILKTMVAEEQSDTELVSRSLAGDRDAFSRIVSRYQTLICSLAYSRIGNLGQSEDIAQETFITAWKTSGQSVEGKPCVFSFLVQLPGLPYEPRQLTTGMCHEK